MRNETMMLDAFEAYMTNFEKHDPEVPEYDLIDLEEIFRAGFCAHREVIWHDAKEVAIQGKTILMYNENTGECEISYGGGSVDEEYWAYLEDVFNADLMLAVRDKEMEIEAWIAEETRRRMKEVVES